MKMPIALVAALLALTTVAHAGNWRVNQQLHNRWWSRPVADFFAANGRPDARWDSVAGIEGLGSHYRWTRGSCRVLIRTAPGGTMAALNSYGACDGVVR